MMRQPSPICSHILVSWLSRTVHPVFRFAHFPCLESAISKELFFYQRRLLLSIFAVSFSSVYLNTVVWLLLVGKKVPFFLASIWTTRYQDRVISSGQAHNVEHWTIGTLGSSWVYCAMRSTVLLLKIDFSTVSQNPLYSHSWDVMLGSQGATKRNVLTFAM